VSARVDAVTFDGLVGGYLREIERNCPAWSRERLRDTPEEDVLRALAREQREAERAGTRTARTDARLAAFYGFWRDLRRDVDEAAA
jgi:hypothetical protein